MKIRSLLPNNLPVTDSPISNYLNTSFFFFLFTSCSSLFIPSLAVAQNAPQISEHLPPPPPLSPRSPVITGNRITRGRSYDILPPVNVEPPTSYIVGREYTFSAPNAPKQNLSVNEVAGYRVEVLGNSDVLLEQVRSIEPKAFSKGDIIQVGIFSDQDNAVNLVRQLALQGMWARIVSK